MHAEHAKSIVECKESDDWSYRHACWRPLQGLSHSPTGEVLDSFSPSSALENTDISDMILTRHTRACY